MTDKDLSDMYWNVKRENKEGTITEAIKTHAQACGLVAFAANIHPDRVARAVRDIRSITPKARLHETV